MENLHELQKFSEKAISTFGRIQNLIPNAMQDKESLENLEYLKQATQNCDDFLKTKNDMEGQNDIFEYLFKMLKVDNFNTITIKHIKIIFDRKNVRTGPADRYATS